jgi:hypothetical protein
MNRQACAQWDSHSVVAAGEADGRELADRGKVTGDFIVSSACEAADGRALGRRPPAGFAAPRGGRPQRSQPPERGGSKIVAVSRSGTVGASGR